MQSKKYESWFWADIFHSDAKGSPLGGNERWHEKVTPDDRDLRLATTGKSRTIPRGLG